MNTETMRLLPHSVEAEKSVLGSIFLSPDSIVQVVEQLVEEDFYLPEHQNIYSAIYTQYNKGEPIDVVTIINTLERTGRLDQVGGVEYITELSIFVPATANLMHYVSIVAERSVMRQLIKTGSQIVQEAQEGILSIADMIDGAERRIYGISMKKKEGALQHIAASAMETYIRMGELMALKGKLSGVTTGFTDLDQLTSGLQRSDIIIVAGRPSMGKTAFALNIAQNAAKKAGAKVCIFSLEMSREQLLRRMLCAHAGVDMQRVNTGNTTDEDALLLANALDEISAMDIYIDDTAGISVSEIRSRCRKQQTHYGLDLIVIDYLQLMKTNGSSENRVTEISEVTRSLKIMARELNVPIILLSQLSRGPETRTSNGHRPVMADLRESGAIEQDADVIMLLYRPAVYAEEGDAEAQMDNSAEIIVAKHRNGPTDTVYLTWLAEYTKYTDRAYRQED